MQRQQNSLQESHSEKTTVHIYEVRPRKDKRGFDLISDVLPFGRLWYSMPGDAVGYAQFFSRSHDALIRVYDAAGNVIETHEYRGDFKDWQGRNKRHS
jgi:hypothetical protein